MSNAPGRIREKPRGQWHTFWNAGDERASLLTERYGIDTDPSSIPGLCARFGLQFG